MLASLKLATLRAAETAGLTSWLLDSHWRRERLLLLCYHGVALSDEHQWAPGLYMSPELFRARMETLRRLGCAILPLDDALQKLRERRLPPRSVALTFDDGSYDFYKVAWPVLREYGFPATVYLTTYYSSYNRPVFDVMLSYLLWKGRGLRLDWPEFLAAPVELNDEGRRDAQRRIRAEAAARGLSAEEKDRLLACLAARLGLDYSALCAARLLHLMNPGELRELAGAGLDIQLHTHRHRLPADRELFLRELEDNRRSIAAVSSAPAVHFCYPSGQYAPQFVPWLRAAGVQSATTCKPGLAARRTDPYRLPRLLDGTGVSAAEFKAWLSGLAAWLPRRRIHG